MKCRILLLTVLPLLPVLLFAQYQPSNVYLNDPDLAVGYVDSCAAFWMNAWDDGTGGFYTNIDRQGNVITSWGTNKNMISQSRDAYGLARAYMLTGDDSYLDRAEAALDFQYAHAWDTQSGGWFDGLSSSGTPLSPNDAKRAFNQHYALLGPLAVFEATRRSTDWEWVQNGLAFLDTTFWDSREGLTGYYDSVARSGHPQSGKSFNATVDAITTHQLALYLLTGDQLYLDQLRELAAEINDHLVASMPAQAIGFVERYDSNWEADDSDPMTIMGHVLKTGWCLARLDRIDPHSEYVDNAETLIGEVWDNGYDHALGGPYKDYDRITGEMLMWGIPDTAKAWWQMEQAVVGGLQMHAATGGDFYLQMADETLEFFMRYFVDHQYGDVYSDRTRYGGQAWGDEKGGGGKAGYHSIELGYYVYLYGHLLLQRTPATLHYRFEAADSARALTLNPFAFPTDQVRIDAVWLEGEPYTDFAAETRTLNIPTDVGGHFTVQFGPTDVDVPPETVVTLPTGPELRNVYPNPFNGTASLVFSLAQPEHARLTVFDLLGRQVATLADREYSAGRHRVAFDASHLASGVYFGALEAGGETKTVRLVLVK